VYRRERKIQLADMGNSNGKEERKNLVDTWKIREEKRKKKREENKRRKRMRKGKEKNRKVYKKRVWSQKLVLAIRGAFQPKIRWNLKGISRVARDTGVTMRVTANSALIFWKTQISGFKILGSCLVTRTKIKVKFV